MEAKSWKEVIEYFKDLHPEDRPQEIYQILIEVCSDEKEALELAEEIEKVAEYADENA